VFDNFVNIGIFTYGEVPA